jgi:lipid II:glycine glycyltransferase (peptidoglycan interpeptide bridge formation enzyme)
MSASGPAATTSRSGDVAGIVSDERTAPAGWDDRAVRVPGGHVMQSSTWAAYRAGQGVEPRFLGFDDGHVALVLLQHSPLTPGVGAVVRRGPAHAEEPVARAVEHARALAAWARLQTGRDLYLDPERAADPAWRSAMEAAGFTVTAGYDPSIHVMRLDLRTGADEDALFGSFSKSTRQRVRAAERAGTVVIDDRAGAHLDGLLVLMRERAEALGIPLQRGDHYLEGWLALLRADLARLLVAEHDDELVGGLFLFRHGGIHATAYSADRAATRRDLPGTMHLVRWIAIRDAFREGVSAIELGGVDLPGLREVPRPGDATYGLYEHKRGFGAIWVEREPPRRIVLRPTADRLAQGRRRLVEAVRSLRS